MPPPNDHRGLSILKAATGELLQLRAIAWRGRSDDLLVLQGAQLALR